MDIKADLNFEQFNTLFAENVVVKKFSAPAKKAIFKRVAADQKNGEYADRGWIHWFIGARELTSVEFNSRYNDTFDELGGPLLDLLYENHGELFKKTGIDFDDDDDSVTDISLLYDNYEMLAADDAFMADVASYINDSLDTPCIALSNKKWLCMWASDEKLS